MEQQLDYVEITVELRKEQQLHDLDRPVVQSALQNIDLLAEAVQAVHNAQRITGQRIELRAGRLFLLRPQPDHELIGNVMVQAGIYGKHGFAAVWAGDTKAGQVLHLGPQLGIAVNIDVVERFVLVLSMTVRAGDGHGTVVPPWCSPN